ncbi:MAG: hypothetical protein ACO1SX_23175 [Actinomycetota bacterium]
MIKPLFILSLLAGSLMMGAARAEDAVFSGPQPGEKTTGFKSLAVTGPDAAREADFPAQFKGAPTVLVFVHGIERSIVPLLTVIDQYALEKKDTARTAFVFLTADRVAMEQRLPLVARSLKLQAPTAISLDGAEGPGNYGLNKKCLLTIVTAKDNRVTANFALVQPGIADAPRVIEAMAKLIGDEKPPTAEELRARRPAR